MKHVFRLSKVALVGGVTALGICYSSFSMAAPPAFVQKRERAQAQNNNVIATPTFSDPTTSGNLIVCAVTYNSPTASVSTVTDSNGGSFSRVGAPVHGGGMSQWSLEVWYKENVAASASYVATAEFDSTFNAYKRISCHEYSGLRLSSSLDHYNSGTGTETTATLPPVTTTEESELVFVATAIWNGPATIDSGFTRRSYYDGDIVADKVVSSTGTYGATVSGTGTGWQSIMASFIAEEQPVPPAPSFISFSPGFFKIYAGSQKTLDGVTLRVTTGGALEVVDASSNILWTSGSTATSCTPSNCYVTLQSDGNMVLYVDTYPLWSTGTYNNHGASLIFQPNAAYLTLRDAQYNVVWSSGGTAALGMLHSSRVGPKAAPVQSFLDSLAINTHMDQYEHDPEVVLDKLNYLGIRSIRDNYPSNDSLLTEYTYLAQNGIRFNMLSGTDNIATRITNAETLAGLGSGVLQSVEGPNEINNFSFTCNGSTWQGGWPNNNGPAADCFMTNYFSALNTSSNLNGVSMYNLTGNTSATNADQYGLLALTNHADFGNIHAYPGGQPYGTLLAGLGSSYFSVLPSQAVITEIGYSTSGSGALSQLAQALMTVNVYLSAFQQGYVKTFLYELTDNTFEGYGLYNTSDQPKTVATALHNLTTILADSGSPVPYPGKLNETLTGMPTKGHKLLLQKSTGVFDLILWNEAQVWNGSDVSVTPSTVNVDLGGTRSLVKVYNPFSGASAINQYTNVSSINVSLGAEALIIEVTP